MYRDDDADPPARVCQVGSTTLKYHLSALVEHTHDARNNSVRAL